MKFQYRVQGKVKSTFVIRGLLFMADSKIDFCVAESELEFAKANCYELKITNLDPVPEVKEVVEPKAEPKIENKESKKDELHPRPRSQKGGNTNKSQSKVSMPK